MTQTKVNSLLESLIGALMAAPTAQLLNWYLMYAWGDVFTDPASKAVYLELSWISFFIHSIVWKYVIRRLLIKYKCENLTTLIRSKLNKTS